MMEQPKTIFEPIFLQFMEQAEIARFSPLERRCYDASMMAYRDVQNCMDTARNDGKKDGKAEALVNLMDSLNLTTEQALQALKIPESEWDEYRNLVAAIEAHPTN